MKWLKNMFSNEKTETWTAYMTGYNGFSDFLLHAPNEKKIEVFTEAARRASEDQRETIRKAGVSL